VTLELECAVAYGLSKQTGPALELPFAFLSPGEQFVKQKPTLVIADDNFPIVEGSLRPLLESDFEIVATVHDGSAAVLAAKEYSPSLMLLDVSLPILRGFDAARAILAKFPDIKILFVSNYAERAYAEEARRIGASGYVLKNRVASELVGAIGVALSGGFYQSPPL
jgi:DNA-binding NarL/FixJ family response regulator